MQSHNQKISATEQDQFSSFVSPVQLISLANLQRRNNIYIPSQCNCCSWLKLDASLIPADNADVATNPRLLANCNTVQHSVTVTHIHRKPSKWNVEEFMEKTPVFQWRVAAACEAAGFLTTFFAISVRLSLFCLLGGLFDCLPVRHI